MIAGSHHSDILRTIVDLLQSTASDKMAEIPHLEIPLHTCLSLIFLINLSGKNSRGKIRLIKERLQAKKVWPSGRSQHARVT